MKAIIVDIDGTLSDTGHRLHHVTGGRKDWGAFFAGMADDPVVPEIRDVVESLADGFNAILLCSGRPETYRITTEKWLGKENIPYTELYMRPEGDRRPDHEVKRQLLDGMRADGFEPWLAIDDRPSIVRMWRDNGITCLQCREWNEAAAPEPGLLTLMVGPSGAGKTDWLASTDPRFTIRLDGPKRSPNLFGIYADQVVSSDIIRKELCGDFRSQDKNDAVFAALHDVVRTRLRHGLPTVVDATNIQRKARLALVNLTGGRVRYIVLDRPIEAKRRDGGWRNEVPFDLIGKHDQTFRSNLRDILAGDGLPNVEVIDLRERVAS